MPMHLWRSQAEEPAVSEWHALAACHSVVARSLGQQISRPSGRPSATKAVLIGDVPDRGGVLDCSASAREVVRCANRALREPRPQERLRNAPFSSATDGGEFVVGQRCSRGARRVENGARSTNSALLHQHRAQVKEEKNHPNTYYKELGDFRGAALEEKPR